MEAKVEKLFSKALLENAAFSFNATSKNAKKLGDFENYVYEVYQNKEPIVLRLTHSSHRSFHDVLAELEWVKFLSDKGVHVARPILSKEGNLVETFEIENTFFYVSCFTKAHGSLVDMNSSLFSESLFYIWGKTIGTMNKATKSFQQRNNQMKRPDWHEEDLLDIGKYLYPSDHKIVQITKELVEELHQLPVDKDSYGLIHSDIHSGNFFYDGKQITVFDFDDCSYHWFISDIAIPLYYTLWKKVLSLSESELTSYAETFFKAFWEGYRTENNLANEWLFRLSLFLRLRDIILYAVLHKKLSKEDLEGRYKDLLSSIRKRIINKRPIVELDYKKLLMI